VYDWLILATLLTGDWLVGELPVVLLIGRERVVAAVVVLCLIPEEEDTKVVFSKLGLLVPEPVHCELKPVLNNVPPTKGGEGVALKPAPILSACIA
jgi:hypothetical protein